jgi:CheY-like chemotaxis protein
MPIKSYARGLIFWVDDNFENQELPDNLWAKIFGDHSDRVFRLLDIYVEVATSFDQALDRIKSFDSYEEAGTFLFCVIDLVIPAHPGTQPEMKYGVSLAKELRNRNITFAFLSSNTGSSNILDEERLQ